MHKMMELRDKLMDELEQQASRQLTEQSLGLIDKLTHSIKSIDSVISMDIEGEYGDSFSGRRYRENYSGEYSGRNRDGFSGRREGGGSSRRRRESMGYSNDGYSGRRGYSRDEAKDKMIVELEGMMGSVSPDAQMAIDRAILALNQE